MKHGYARQHPAGSGLCAVAGILGTMFLAVSAASQEPAYVENTHEVTATITAVEPETRLLTLRSEDGRELVVEAGEQVRNFDQIEAGDRVDVTFFEALVAEVTDAPATEEMDEPVLIESRRAPLGEKPEGVVGMVYTAVVTIDEVDPEKNTVTFTGPGGQPRELLVQRPEMQEFIKGLTPGDRVQVSYGEALAVSVRPSE
jgi:hypothetical protein